MTEKNKPLYIFHLYISFRYNYILLRFSKLNYVITNVTGALSLMHRLTTVCVWLVLCAEVITLYTATDKAVTSALGDTVL